MPMSPSHSTSHGFFLACFSYLLLSYHCHEFYLLFFYCCLYSVSCMSIVIYMYLKIHIYYIF